MTTDIKHAAQLAEEASHEDPSWIATPISTPSDTANITQRAIDVYMLSKRPNGEMGGIGWWQSANGYTAMALHDLWNSSTHNYDTLFQAIHQCERRHPGLINKFNDDSLWWAMLCMHMYALKGDTWFLEKAKGIWRHVRDSGSICQKGEVFFKGDDMEGAVYWTTRPGEEQINSITTGLYAELSARLALVQLRNESGDGYIHTGTEISAKAYVEAARYSLGWILRCRYRPREGIVLDHFKLKKEKAVDWTFTYLTGVALGVCALLYEATREDEYMVLACHMASRSMARKGWVENNGVLTEKGAYGRGTHDPFKPNDAVGFKAVLVRQLCMLYDVISRTQCWMPKAQEVNSMIKQFVGINFQAQQERNTNGKDQFGPWWNGPFEYPTSHSQMAVLDIMISFPLVK